MNMQSVRTLHMQQIRKTKQTFFFSFDSDPSPSQCPSFDMECIKYLEENQQMLMCFTGT